MNVFTAALLFLHVFGSCIALTTVKSTSTTSTLTTPPSITVPLQQYQPQFNATLYAYDPIAHTLSLNKGNYGGIIEYYGVYNQGCDIDFNAYQTGNFTVGIEGGRVGRIMDIGSAASLQQYYGYPETVGSGQGYASIYRKNNQVYILKSYYTNPITVQPIIGSSMLFNQGIVEAGAIIQLGHIYLIRITDINDKSFELVAKLLVIAFTPNVSVTIRWALL
jgi:hypothetical protein